MLSDSGSTLSTNEVLRIDWMISVYAHRWILLIHIHHAVESGKAHDVMVKGMQKMLAVWLALRKTCQVDFVKMLLAGNCHCLAAPVTAFSRFSGVCLMILAAKWWIASPFKMLHLAFYGVRAFERSMYSTLVPEQQLWKQQCFPILAVLCQQMRCSVLDDKHVQRWIIFIHIQHAEESGKAHDVMVKGMQKMLAVWLALRKTCQVDFVKMFLAGNCHCLAAPVTAFSRFSGVCLMILAAKWWIASLFKMLHLAFYGVRAFERSMYSTLVPEQQLWKQQCFPILAVFCQQIGCSILIGW